MEQPPYYKKVPRAQRDPARTLLPFSNYKGTIPSFPFLNYKGAMPSSPFEGSGTYASRCGKHAHHVVLAEKVGDDVHRPAARVLRVGADVAPGEQRESCAAERLLVRAGGRAATHKARAIATHGAGESRVRWVQVSVSAPRAMGTNDR